MIRDSQMPSPPRAGCEDLGSRVSASDRCGTRHSCALPGRQVPAGAPCQNALEAEIGQQADVSFFYLFHTIFNLYSISIYRFVPGLDRNTS